MNAKDLLLYQAYAGETSGSSEPSVTVEPLEVVENGEYTAPERTAYSPVTVNVPTGGGGGVSEDDDVLFIDYDGTLLYSYSAEDFLALTEMPANPEHDGLVAQGWNWSLADAQEYVRDYGMQVIGQMYTTESGATEVDIVLGDERKTPYLGVRVNGSLSVDWGDGSAVETVTGTSITSTKKVPHEYASAGTYTIKISGTGLNLGAASNAGADLLTSGNGGQYIDAYYRARVRAIRLGPGVTIQDVAFSHLTDVETITFPADATFTNTAYTTYASNLTVIKAVVLPPTAVYIGNSGFNNCHRVRYVSVGKNIQSLSQTAFNACHALKRFACPVGVTSIGYTAFNYCYALERVVLPSGVTSIGDSAFASTRALKHVELPIGLQSLGANVFNNSGIVEAVIPRSVTTMGMSVFSSAEDLETCDLRAQITTLPGQTFNNCKSLERITLPTTLTTLGANAIYSCPILEEVELPAGVTELKGSSVSGLNVATKIVIPSGVTTIGSSALSYNTALRVLRFEPTTPPTVANSNAFTSLPTDCIIEVPAGTLSAYTSAANYPSASTYTYREFTE